jgi:outer membrane lipoprotein carrier protein
MKHIIVCLLLITSLSSFAQNKSYTENSDPEAKKVLQKLQKSIANQDGITATFTLTIQAGDDKEVQTGEIMQKGEFYRVKNSGNEIICNGEVVWVYIKKQNEVQINDFDEDDEDIMSPSKIMKIYEHEKDFFYAITNEDSRLYQIEFKPRDEDAEYKKIRLEVKKGNHTLSKVIVFGEDGTRYTFQVNSISKKTIAPSNFKFTKSKYPGVKVIDMRL